MPYSPLTLRPTSSGRLCCPVLLVGPSAFVGSPPCSHHCPSIYLHWALSCSSRSLSERTEHQADSHSIPVLTQRGDVGLCFTVKCAGQPMTVRDTSRAVTPQCRDTNARECLKVRWYGKRQMLPAHIYIFNNASLHLRPKKWSSIHLLGQVKKMKSKVTLPLVWPGGPWRAKMITFNRNWKDQWRCHVEGGTWVEFWRTWRTSADRGRAPRIREECGWPQGNNREGGMYVCITLGRGRQPVSVQVRRAAGKECVVMATCTFVPGTATCFNVLEVESLNHSLSLGITTIPFYRWRNWDLKELYYDKAEIERSFNYNYDWHQEPRVQQRWEGRKSWAWEWERGGQAEGVRKRWVCACCDQRGCELADGGGFVPLWSENVHNESSAWEMIMALEGIMKEDKCVLCTILNAATGESRMAWACHSLGETARGLCSRGLVSCSSKDQTHTYTPTCLNLQHLLTSLCKYCPRGWFQGTNRMSLNMELGRGVCAQSLRASAGRS